MDGEALVVRERVTPTAVVPRVRRKFAWLCPLVPSWAAGHASQMRVVLAEPEMQALLSACPQAIRVLRPLCFMLGIAPADYIPGWTARPSRVNEGEVTARPVRKRARRAPRNRWAGADEATLAAHYAFTGVPKRFWFRVT
jgi:hypothetical protein